MVDRHLDVIGSVRVAGVGESDDTGIPHPLTHPLDSALEIHGYQPGNCCKEVVTTYQQTVGMLLSAQGAQRAAVQDRAVAGGVVQASLLRLSASNIGATSASPRPASLSPSTRHAGSTLCTVAPHEASSLVHRGPTHIAVMSMTVVPASGAAGAPRGRAALRRSAGARGAPGETRTGEPGQSEGSRRRYGVTGRWASCASVAIASGSSAAAPRAAISASRSRLSSSSSSATIAPDPTSRGPPAPTSLVGHQARPSTRAAPAGHTPPTGRPRALLRSVRHPSGTAGRPRAPVSSISRLVALGACWRISAPSHSKVASPGLVTSTTTPPADSNSMHRAALASRRTTAGVDRPRCFRDDQQSHGMKGLPRAFHAEVSSPRSRTGFRQSVLPE